MFNDITDAIGNCEHKKCPKTRLRTDEKKIEMIMLEELREKNVERQNNNNYEEKKQLQCRTAIVIV